MKLIIVGNWSHQIYEESFSTALISSGVNVIPCKIDIFFKGKTARYRLALPRLDFLRWRLNRYVIDLIKKEHPDYVLFWRPTHISLQTLKTLAEIGVKTISYNNDDPFGPSKHKNAPWHHNFLWSLYLKNIPYFDRNFFYRKINVDEAYTIGARHADVLLPYFLPEKDHPVKISRDEQDRFNCDVVFVGHFEPDGRELSIRMLLNSGVKVKLWGGGRYWSPKILGSAYSKLAPIRHAEGEDYAKALCGAKICLAFLSKLNRDTYTRRCFEIPACGRVMLAERTVDLTRIFKEDEEACFFSSNEELIEKVKWLLDNPVIREQIAKAGMRRVWIDGHDVRSRAQQFLEKLI